MKMDETKRYKLVIGVLVLVNVLIVAVWWLFYMPQSTEGKRNKQNEWRNQGRDFMEQALKLDESQKVVFNALGEAHMKMVGKLNREIDSLKSCISKEIMNAEGPSVRIDSLFNTIALKRAAVDTSIYHHFRRLRKVCKPEQVVAFDSLMTEFLSRRDRGGRHRARQDTDGRHAPGNKGGDAPRNGPAR